MLQRLKDFFVPAGKFRIVPRAPKLPECKIRTLQASDIDACELIYKLNEPKRFPPGYFSKFSTWLRNGHALVLVAEQHGSIRALGGINAQEQDGRHFACLSFGMVHPAYHRQGFGTALLLARLALLRTNKDFSLATLNTVGGSETFYGRFGFAFVHAIQATPEYLQKHYVAKVSTQDKLSCATALGPLWTPFLSSSSDIPPLYSPTDGLEANGYPQSA